jgi:hypothetical protein
LRSLPVLALFCWLLVSLGAFLVDVPAGLILAGLQGYALVYAAAYVRAKEPPRR